jgi:hypothetical protein
MRVPESAAIGAAYRGLEIACKEEQFPKSVTSFLIIDNLQYDIGIAKDEDHGLRLNDDTKVGGMSWAAYKYRAMQPKFMESDEYQELDAEDSFYCQLLIEKQTLLGAETPIPFISKSINVLIPEETSIPTSMTK